ncbi:MAG: tryptophan--tRNA ligase [Candidatus Altiarchaeota archaeon]|nr:tryptophan--tRNA ligase [Candidatus Altiarchaeota archaeon]
MAMTAYDVEGEVDYEKVVKKFGASLIDDSLAKKLDHPLVPELFFAHRDLDKILANPKGFAVISGRGPSMNMHIGHLLIFKFVKHLQDKFNAFVFLPFSDDEKLLARGLTIEHVLQMSYENLLDMLALGFDPKKTEVMIDLATLKQEVYNLSIEAASHMTMSTVKAAFGFSDDVNIGIHFYPGMQAAHILYPTKKLGVPTIVPIGIDQDVFVKLTRDVAPKMGLAKPGDIMSKFLPGLTGGKMSSSKPETAIFTTDTPDAIKKKIANAFTGGLPTAKEQREKGGNPDVCVVYKYLRIFFGIDVRKQCRSGTYLCGDCKGILTKEMQKMLKDHQSERVKVEKNLEKFSPELGDLRNKFKK